MRDNAKLVEKLVAAKVHFRKIQLGEKSMRDIVADVMLDNAWHLGRILSDLKEEIGHGKWLFWLGGTWPELGERNAQRCIGFFKANEKWTPLKSEEFRGLDIDSVRKFMWNYIPAKDRLELTGDQEITPRAHHLTVANAFSKWDRQLRSGHVENFQLELFKTEMEPMIRRLVEICGRDYIVSILG